MPVAQSVFRLEHDDLYRTPADTIVTDDAKRVIARK